MIAVKIYCQLRLLGVVIHEVKPKLGVIQGFRDIAERNTKLAVILSVDVASDIGDDERTGLRVKVFVGAKRPIPNQPELRRQGVCPQNLRNQRVVDACVCSIAPVTEQIRRGEEGTHRIDCRLFPIPLVVGFHR
ncbi:hypothetical protein D3C76_1349090 [compost metagenome]